MAPSRSPAAPRRALVLAFVVAALALGGCTDSKEGAGLSFRDVEIGTRSGYGVEDVSGFLIEDQHDWDVFWENHTRGRKEPPAQPPIDFEKEFAFAAVYGWEQRVGYAIRIESVGYTAGHYEIGYRTAQPSMTCATQKATVNPYHIVAIERVQPGRVDLTFTSEGDDALPCN